MCEWIFKARISVKHSCCAGPHSYRPTGGVPSARHNSIRLETTEWLTSGGKNVHCSLQDRGVKVASGGTGFVNSAGTAGPIRTSIGSFDVPERRNDGGDHVAPRATCRRVNPSKNVVSGLQPKRKVAGSPNFQVRSALV